MARMENIRSTDILFRDILQTASSETAREMGRLASRQMSQQMCQTPGSHQSPFKGVDPLWATIATWWQAFREN